MIKVVYNGEKEAKAVKDIIGETMAELFAQDKDVIYLDADLMNSFGMTKHWKAMPDRVINCGIMEANMIGVAAGLSAVGKKPYAHTFGPFASRRAFDQSFLSVAYARNNVRVIGSDPGVCAAFNGGTHMPFEDMALMRSVPGAMVLDICDGTQFKFVIKAVKDRAGLTYIRTTRKNYVRIYGEESTFELGKGNIVREGKDVSIIAGGIMVAEALKAAKQLESEGISAMVVDMFTVKPLDAELVIKCAKLTGAVVTAENHNVIGGLGSAVCETLAENCPVPAARVGVNDEFGEVGTEDYLRERFRLTAANIAEKAKLVISRK